MFGDSQFTSTLSVNFHFPKIPRRTENKPQVLIMFYSTVYVKIMSRYFAKTAVIVSHIGLSEVICSLH